MGLLPVVVVLGKLFLQGRKGREREGGRGRERERGGGGKDSG